MSVVVRLWAYAIKATSYNIEFQIVVYYLCYVDKSILFQNVLCPSNIIV